MGRNARSVYDPDLPLLRYISSPGNTIPQIFGQQTRTERSYQWAVTTESQVSLLQNENTQEEAWTFDFYNPSSCLNSLMLREELRGPGVS